MGVGGYNLELMGWIKLLWGTEGQEVTLLNYQRSTYQANKIHVFFPSIVEYVKATHLNYLFWLQYQTSESGMEQSQPFPDAQQSSEGVYFNLQQNKSSQTAGLIQEGLAKQARSAFVIKVYLLLTLELAVTFGMCLLAQYCEPFRNFQLDYAWVIIFPILLLMASMGIAMAVPAARKFPLDMVVLFIFILSFSYMISFCCSEVVDQVQGPVVVIAIGTTVGIVIAITLYSIYCRANFVVLFGIIIVVAITMFMVGMVALFTFEPVLISIYCGLAVIIYGIYLVFITKMIIGGQMGEGFPMDSYIIASLLLYIYIIKMFLMILRIVALSKRGK